MKAIYRVAEPLGWLLFAALMLALMAKSALGDEPAYVATVTPARTIPAVTVPPSITITISNRPANPKDAFYVWLVAPKPADLKKDAGSASWTAVPGTKYTFAYVCKEAGKEQVSVDGEAVAGEPKPDPGPGPQPPPDPLPPTDEVAAVVLLVADSGASSPLTPEQRLFLLDESAERRKLSELGIKNYQVAPGSDADAKGYSKFLAEQKVPPPAVIAIYKNGSKRAIKLPPNGAEFLKSVGVKP